MNNDCRAGSDGVCGGDEMTKKEWMQVITKLDNFDVFDVAERCAICKYEYNCDEHTDCNEGMAEFMAGIEKEVNNE